MADRSATDAATCPAPPEPQTQRWAPQIAAPLDEDVQRLVQRSTAAQGLLFHVQDPAVLARVAALVNTVRGKEAARGVPRNRPTNPAVTRRP
jgi:hypothetical protein